MKIRLFLLEGYMGVLYLQVLRLSTRLGRMIEKRVGHAKNLANQAKVLMSDQVKVYDNFVVDDLMRGLRWRLVHLFVHLANSCRHEKLSLIHHYQQCSPQASDSHAH